jgi:hypothetical protein
LYVASSRVKNPRREPFPTNPTIPINQPKC